MIYRKLKINSKLCRRKIERKFTWDGIKKYAYSEIPGNALGFFCAAGTAEFVRRTTGSDIYSAYLGTFAGDLGLLVGKTMSYRFLHHKDYSEGSRSAPEDMKNLTKSVGVAMGFNLILVAPLQFFLQNEGGIDPALATVFSGIAAGSISLGRWGYDFTKGLASSGKVKGFGGLENKVSQEGKD